MSQIESARRSHTPDLPVVGRPLEEVKEYIQAIQAQFPKTHPANFFVANIPEATPTGRANRLAIGFNVNANAEPKDEAWLSYINRFPAPTDLGVLVHYMKQTAPDTYSVVRKKVYLRDFPDLGFMSVESLQQLQTLKNINERETTIQGEMETARKQRILAKAVEFGFYGSDRSTEAGEQWSPPEVSKERLLPSERDEEMRIEVEHMPTILFLRTKYQNGDPMTG